MGGQWNKSRHHQHSGKGSEYRVAVCMAGWDRISTPQLPLSQFIHSINLLRILQSIRRVRGEGSKCYSGLVGSEVERGGERRTRPASRR